MMSSCRNESYMNSDIPDVGNIYRLFTVLIIATLSSFTYRRQKSGENKQINIQQPETLKSRNLKRLPSHCPRSYHFLLNESVLFPESLTSCSCYWLTKEVSNYKKIAFCSFQGLGGFCVLDIRQRKCNLCKVQITRYNSRDVTYIYTRFWYVVHHLATAQIAKHRIFVFWGRSNRLVIKGYSWRFVVLFWDFHMLCIKMQHL